MSKSKKMRCLHCEFSCGRGGALEIHVNEKHGFCSLMDSYAFFHHAGIIPKCGCGCGESVSWTWSKGFARFVKGHNGNIVACYGEDRAKEISSKRSAALRGKVGWAKGLTKENSEVIRQRAESSAREIKKTFSDGRRQWNAGLSASSDHRIAALKDKIIDDFNSGRRVAWHKGKDKMSCPGLQKMSDSIRKRFEDRSLRNRLTAIKRLSSDEIMERLRTNASSLELVSNIQQYTRDRHNNLVFRCKECGDTRQRSLLSALTNRCHTCNPNGSKAQLEISKFIRQLGISHVISNRSEISPYELDIWSSSAGIAIEYNGLYFHNENFKDKNYHSKKTDLANKRNIKLLHIFEDEWRERRQIIESVVSNKFGIANKRIFARKCEIRMISRTERKSFFESTHIDGDAPARIAWGLFFEGSLVAALSLRRPLNKKYAESIELCRFSCVLNTVVVGGLSKLVKKARMWSAKNSFSNIMTYVDTRHGDGHGYEKIGFNVIGKTANRFWWTDDVNRYDRFVFRADSKNGLTEKQVAEKAGVKKIWGCPNLILTLPVNMS